MKRVKRQSKAGKGTPSPVLVADAASRKPPWLGSLFEAPLNRIGLDPEHAQAFPVSHAGHEQFWNWIYACVQRIGEDFRGDSPGQTERLKAVARRYGFAEPKKEAQPLPSREAAKRRKIARNCEKLAAEVDPYQPKLAEILRGAGSAFAYEAGEISKLWQGQKRHREHAETRRIRDLMDLIKHETGKWYGPETCKLLNLAGLKHYRPANLRELRARKR